MAKLIALQPVNHDGKDVAEGDTFTVSDEAQIAQLVESGSAVVKGSKSKADATAEVAAVAAQAAADADAAAVAEAALQVASASKQG